MTIEEMLLNSKLDLIRDALLFNDLYKSKSIVIEIKVEINSNEITTSVNITDRAKNKFVSTN